MNNNGWYTKEEMLSIGFKSLGDNVMISNKCSIYGAKNISLGSNIRIDDFTILAASSGELVLEGYNHIASFCYLNSSAGITMKKFSGLSSRCSLYSTSDKYDGSCMTNPTVPEEFLDVISGEIVLGKHVVVGNNSTILPGCKIGEGSAVGAFSLVTKDISDFKISVGIPAKELKDRKREFVQMEKEWLD